MRALRNIALLATAFTVSVSCSGNKAQASATTDGNSDAQPAEENNVAAAAPAANDGKTLIIFFSHAGDNYSVGNIKEGNTKLVADEIQKVTGADVFEIVAEKSYDMAYRPLTELAKKEADDGELPAYKGSVDVSQYSTVFVGGPIWWGTYPRVMFTFFSKNDLNGKTLIPFTTHEGSGLGNVVSDLKAQYPNATVTDGFSIAGHDVRGGLDKVDAWLKSIGY